MPVRVQSSITSFLMQVAKFFKTFPAYEIVNYYIINKIIHFISCYLGKTVYFFFSHAQCSSADRYTISAEPESTGCFCESLNNCINEVTYICKEMVSYHKVEKPSFRENPV